MPDKGRSSTPKASSVLEDLRVLEDRVAERIRELEPFEQELSQLREQADRLGIDLSPAPAKRRSSGAPAKKAGVRARRASTAKPRRRRRSANGESRADQVLALVREQPDVSVVQVADRLGVDSTGLYRVVRNLEAEGLIRKDGRALRPVEQGALSADEAERATA